MKTQTKFDKDQEKKFIEACVRRLDLDGSQENTLKELVEYYLL